MKLLLLAISSLLLLSLTSCKQADPGSTEAAYLESLKSQQIGVELPISRYVNKGPSGASHGIIVVVKNDTYQIEDQPLQDSMDLDKAIEQEIKKLSPAPRFLLIAASPEAHFKRIRTAIRSAARAGLTDIYFAIKENKSHLNLIQSKLHLNLPCACDDIPELCPLFIKIDQYGAIYINTGPEQEALDTDVKLRQLPQLSKRLTNYAAAARAGAHQPFVQIWVDGEASYQRVIDLLTELSQANIKSLFFTDLIDSKPAEYGGCILQAPNIQPYHHLPIAPKYRHPLQP